MDVVRNYQRWLDLIEDTISHPDAEFPRRRVQHELLSTFDTEVSWNWEDADGAFGAEWSHPRDGWPGQAETDLWLNGGHDNHPLIRWFAATGDPRPMSLGRVPASMVSPASVDLVRALAPDDKVNQLSIPYQLGPGYQAFVLAKDGDDYSDEAFELARLIGPLLGLVWRQVVQLQRYPTEGAGLEHGRHTGVHAGLHAGVEAGLTGRELAVLRLLADGLTAQAMGHRLGISPRTVHTHLANLYRKLGVTDRVRAVMVAQAAGLFAAGNESPGRACAVNTPDAPSQASTPIEVVSRDVAALRVVDPSSPPMTVR